MDRKSDSDFIEVKQSDGSTVFVRLSSILYLDCFDKIGCFDVVMHDRRLRVDRQSFEEIKRALGLPSQVL